MFREEEKIDTKFRLERDYENHTDIIYADSFFSSRRIDPKDFFQMQRNMFKKDGSYQLFPNLTNGKMDKVEYLKEKSLFTRLNNLEPDFGDRVDVKVKFLNYEELKKMNSFPYFLDLEVRIFKENTFKEIYTTPFKTRVWLPIDNYESCNYSEEMWALMFKNSMNGNRQTMEDIEKLLKQRNLDIYLEEGWEIFKCDECGKKFTSLRQFLCHLANEGHYDSFLDEFPNTRRIEQLKYIISERKKGIIV